MQAKSELIIKQDEELLDAIWMDLVSYHDVGNKLQNRIKHEDFYGMADEVVKTIAPLVNEKGTLNSGINDLLLKPYSLSKTKGTPNSKIKQILSD